MSRAVQLFGIIGLCAVTVGLASVGRVRAQPDPQMPDDAVHGGAAGNPHGGMPTPQIAVANESTLVPPGSIRVTVVDRSFHPIANAEVNVGTMAEGNKRTRIVKHTDASGRVVFSGLPTGTAQAYRVNVPADGATYSCMPFRLAEEHGYDVRIVRLPTTHDDRNVLVGMGQLVLELKDERVTVQERLRLINVGQDTYAFPTAGLVLRLPPRFKAFQAPAVMTDQRIAEAGAEGVRIFGSLPPGQVEIGWQYDLETDGTSELSITTQLPFKVYMFEVLVDAAPGLELDVEGMPPARVFEQDGHKLLGTGIERRPGDAALRAVQVHVRGIPGPGPARWIAIGVGAVIMLVGVYFALSGGKRRESVALAREARKTALLDEAVALERQRAEGEVGEGYYAQRREAIVTELAVCLHDEADAKAKSPASTQG